MILVIAGIWVTASIIGRRLERQRHHNQLVRAYLLGYGAGKRDMVDALAEVEPPTIEVVMN